MTEAMRQLFSLFVDFERAMVVFSLCVPRLMATFLVFPLTGPSIMPRLVRGTLIVSLAILVFPGVMREFPRDGLEVHLLFAILAKEIFIGFLIGYLASLIFWAVESIGHFIDTHRGATLAGALYLNFGQESSPVGGLLLQLAMVIFLVSGGMRVFLEGFYQSYVAWPVLSYFPEINSASAIFFVEQFALVAFIAVVFGAPVVITMFLAEFVLAVTSRFVPQLQVFFLALPIKSAVGFLVLIIYIEFMFYYLSEHMARIGTYFTDLLGLLS